MLLSLALAVQAFAGHIETPGAPAPPGTTTTTIVIAIVSLIYG